MAPSSVAVVCCRWKYDAVALLSMPLSVLLSCSHVSISPYVKAGLPSPTPTPTIESSLQGRDGALSAVQAGITDTYIQPL
jgi:hypothetical protein